jgi:hypothetical protein
MIDHDVALSLASDQYGAGGTDRGSRLPGSAGTGSGICGRRCGGETHRETGRRSAVEVPGGRRTPPARRTRPVGQRRRGRGREPGRPFVAVLGSPCSDHRHPGRNLSGPDPLRGTDRPVLGRARASLPSRGPRRRELRTLGGDRVFHRRGCRVRSAGGFAPPRARGPPGGPCSRHRGVGGTPGPPEEAPGALRTGTVAALGLVGRGGRFPRHGFSPGAARRRGGPQRRLPAGDRRPDGLGGRAWGQEGVGNECGAGDRRAVGWARGTGAVPLGGALGGLARGSGWFHGPCGGAGAGAASTGP